MESQAKLGLRGRLCFELSRRLMQPPDQRTAEVADYGEWRHNSLSSSWSSFPDSAVASKDVLDFGCGYGALSLFLAKEKRPRRIVGVDIDGPSIERARANLAATPLPEGVQAEFIFGSTDRMPVPDRSFDTLLAFDCLEHVMSPGSILKDWHRVLKPGGRCLIEWFPYKGPWGPHMQSLIPIPWSHVIFGEKALFRAARRLYDLPEFVPRHWDRDEKGNKKPNKWLAWSSFEEQGYINKLDLPTFERLAREAGFEIPRFERSSLRGSALRRAMGHVLMRMPLIGESFVSFVRVELLRPA